MAIMSTRAARTLRGLAVAIVSTALAAISHVLGGGMTPSAPALLLGLAFATVTGVALAGKRTSTARLAASVVVGQGAFHAVFSVLTTTGSVEHLGHHSDVLVPGQAHTADPRMWVGHAIAGVITFALLRFGAAALRVIRRVLVPVARAPHAVPVDSMPRIPITDAVLPRLRERVLSLQLFRGPPVVAF